MYDRTVKINIGINYNITCYTFWQKPSILEVLTVFSRKLG